MLMTKLALTLGLLAISGLSDALVPVSRQLPFPEYDFGYAAAACQTTYCGWSYNQPGKTFEDSTIYSSYGDQNHAQRVTLSYSPNRGIYVAVAGTNASYFRSDLRDAEFLPMPPSNPFNLSEGSLVFMGWQNGFNDIWQFTLHGLIAMLQDHNDAPITVTGHSQGAGIATLLGLAVDNKFPGKLRQLITFGNVRVGNKKFADEFNKQMNGRSVGVANGQDWVADMPPKFLGYEHTAGQVWITPANSTEYYYYADGDDPAWMSKYEPHIKLLVPGTFPPEVYWGDHQGYYMNSQITGTLAPFGVGPCPGAAVAPR